MKKKAIFFYFCYTNNSDSMKKLRKNKKNVLKLILFVVMLYLFIVLGTKDYNVKIADNIRFATEYKDISKNNIFKYVNENEALEILNNKTGILFLGFSSNIWSHYFADYVNEIAMLHEVKEIYYYDFYKDRQLNNKIYKNIVTKLDHYLLFSDTNQKVLNAPIIIILKNGEVIYFNNEISFLTGEIKPEDYFTDYRKNLIKMNLDKAILEMVGESNG